MDLEREGAKANGGAKFALRVLRLPSRLRVPNPSAFLLVLLLPLLSSCTFPGNAAPVLKLGVIAPFEGRARALGYAILPEIKAAVAEANAAGAFGPYRITVVAFNDNLDPATARQQAAALALDPDVAGVIGPLWPETAAIDQDYTREQVQAKEAARSLLQTLAADIQAHGRPTRATAAP